MSAAGVHTAMRLKVFRWHGDDFLSMSADGSGAGTVEKEVGALFGAFESQLQGMGLGLRDVVRTRMFTRDMDVWLRANQERRRILDGEARSVSSSHVWAGRLGERARVSIDLVALFPGADGRRDRVRREYDPPQFPLRSMAVGPWVFLSGVTDMTHATIEEQFPTILSRIAVSLADTGVGWKDVVKVSCLLHHDEAIDVVRGWFRQRVPELPVEPSWAIVGSRQGKRIEVEVTARRA